MSVERELKKRARHRCELCGREDGLSITNVSPYTEESVNHSIVLCSVCSAQVENPETADPNHWRMLNDSIWHELDAIKVVSWRMLHHLKLAGVDWAADLQDMMYMEEQVEEWAKDGLPKEGALIHKDSNGVTLSAGDSVVLIKDLDVKGSSLTAKRGTAVRNIRLDPENETFIEGKVEGQTIVIITEYVKKT